MSSHFRQFNSPVWFHAASPPHQFPSFLGLSIQPPNSPISLHFLSIVIFGGICLLSSTFGDFLLADLRMVCASLLHNHHKSSFFKWRRQWPSSTLSNSFHSFNSILPQNSLTQLNTSPSLPFCALFQNSAGLDCIFPTATHFPL
jgi:hypothetical protein